MYTWTGLLIKPALVGTHVDVRFEIEESLYSFRARRGLRPRSCLSGTPLVFLLRYALQVLQIRSRCLNPGNYWVSNLIQSSIITFTSTTLLLLKLISPCVRIHRRVRYLLLRTGNISHENRPTEQITTPRWVLPTYGSTRYFVPYSSVLCSSD